MSGRVEPLRRGFLWRYLVYLSMVLGSKTGMAADSAPVAQAMPVVATEVQVPEGFQVQRLISMPADRGSWISMTFDPQGRILVSHQGNRMHRIRPAQRNDPASQTTVEEIQTGVGGAHGLLYALGSLYAVTGAAHPQTGVYRIPDVDGQGKFGPPELLVKIPGGGEHGPHGIVLGPQRRWLYFIAGNATGLPEGITRNHVAQIAPTPQQQRPRPQGWVMRIAPDGRQRELFSMGLRNAYDLAFDTEGELFTFDSDNEGFMGLPWYRPTNIYHVVSGADFGWRQSEKNLPAYYPDNPPPVREVGPGSPTGVVFGTGTAFPRKYQRSLFVCDWSYGRIYALHLQPRGATYGADWEFFASGRPLPATDIQVGPDGALYFITGGRGTPGHLYRVIWSGESVPPAAEKAPVHTALKQRRALEDLNGRVEPQAVMQAWPFLGSADRALRYAARVAIEHQDPKDWQQRVTRATDTQVLLTGLIALARQGDTTVRPQIFEKLFSLDWESLSLLQRHALLRVYGITFERMALPEGKQRKAVRSHLNGRYPTASGTLNRELATLRYQLETPQLADRTLAVLERTPTLMRQIHYLRLVLKRGIQHFTIAQRARLIAALDPHELRAIVRRPYADQKRTFSELIKQLGIDPDPPEQPVTRPLVKQWTVSELLPVVTATALQNANRENGQVVFRVARCANCHRLGNTGGVLGPQLNGLAGRYRPEEILESLVLPSKVISDQYRTTIFIKQDGTQVTGQIVDLAGQEYRVRTDPFQPFARIRINKADVEAVLPSQISLMPRGILDRFTRQEIRDLVAYLIEPFAPGLEVPRVDR